MDLMTLNVMTLNVMTLNVMTLDAGEPDLMNIVALVAGVIFGISALLAVYRIIRGPSVLDRVIASDVLVATIMCVLGAEMALNRHVDNLPVLLVLSLFAVLGSLSVARFLPAKEDK
jgi:multicomponent Na+:H+ antiporter subunit F